MILIGIPTYDNQTNAQLSLTLMNEIARKGNPPFVVTTHHSSLLARGFNTLYCNALNKRPEVIHFLMIHSDIVPEPGFIRKMYKEMGRTKADVLSVVLPLKDNRGLTSTALLDSTIGENPRRVSVSELDNLPETFGKDDLADFFKGRRGSSTLLVNSGLMLVNLQKPWVEKVWFAIEDYIFKNKDGKFETYTFSEDWFYSKQAQMRGAKVMATQIVRARHIGDASFPNWGRWGLFDQEEDEKTKEVALA